MIVKARPRSRWPMTMMMRETPSSLSRPITLSTADDARAARTLIFRKLPRESGRMRWMRMTMTMRTLSPLTTTRCTDSLGYLRYKRTNTWDRRGTRMFKRRRVIGGFLINVQFMDLIPWHICDIA